MSESDANQEEAGANGGEQPDGAGGEGKPAERSDAITQQIRHQQISARIPEGVAGGTFSTGAIVLQGPHEFVVDFIVSLTRPHQVVARVVLPPTVLPQVIKALQENLNKYSERFGPPKELPKPAENQRKPSIEEIYEDLKLPDERLSGTYANAVIIGHSAAEFSFDFVTSFFPRAGVSSRLFLSAQHVPRLLETLNRSFAQYQQRVAQARQQMQQKLQDPNLRPGKADDAAGGPPANDAPTDQPGESDEAPPTA